MTCDVAIVGGNHRQDGTVGMNHSQEYSVRLTNGFNRRVDVRLSIDGEVLDVFRLRAFGSATIETKPNSGKRLTFYKLHTAQAVAGQMILDHSAAVTIHLRLVCQGSDIQPLHSPAPPRPMY